MSRPRLPDHEKRQKWAVLNVVPAERASIEAAAREAELTVNAFILSCTRTTEADAEVVTWVHTAEDTKYAGETLTYTQIAERLVLIRGLLAPEA